MASGKRRACNNCASCRGAKLGACLTEVMEARTVIDTSELTLGPDPNPRSSRVFRNGILVDVTFQIERVKNHCFAAPIENWTIKETTLTDGTPVSFLSMKEEPRCPSGGYAACEIYIDHIKLGLSEDLLPCMGAVTENEEGFDASEMNETLREACK